MPYTPKTIKLTLTFHGEDDPKIALFAQALVNLGAGVPFGSEYEFNENAMNEQTNDCLRFLKACCIVAPHVAVGGQERSTGFLRTRTDILYSAYVRWYQENGTEGTYMVSRSFGIALKNCGLQPARSNGARYWKGVALRGHVVRGVLPIGQVGAP